MHTCLVTWMTWGHIQLSVLSPIFPFPCFHCLKTVSSHFFLTHILYKFLHALSESRVYLLLLFFQLEVPCSVHAQGFGGIVHLVPRSDEPMHVPVFPSTCISLLLAPQLLLHYLLSCLLATFSSLATNRASS